MKTSLLTFTLALALAAAHASPPAPQSPITVALSSDDRAAADAQEGSFAALARADARRGTLLRYDDDRDSFTQGSEHDSHSDRRWFDHDDRERYFDDFDDRDDDHHQVAAVPEPATWLMLLGGVVALAVGSVRKSRGA